MKTIIAIVTAAMKNSFWAAKDKKGNVHKLRESHGPMHTEQGLYFPFLSETKHFTPDFYPVVGDRVVIMLDSNEMIKRWGLASSWNTMKAKLAEHHKLIQYRLMLRKQDESIKVMVAGTADELSMRYPVGTQLEYHPDFVGNVFEGEFFYWERKTSFKPANVPEWGECADPRQSVSAQVTKVVEPVQKKTAVKVQVAVEKKAENIRITHNNVRKQVVTPKPMVAAVPRRERPAPMCSIARLELETAGLKF